MTVPAVPSPLAPRSAFRTAAAAVALATALLVGPAAAVAQQAAGERPGSVVVERPASVGGADTVRARGEGPYDRLVIRGATLVDGSGAPPRGPVDVVVEGDRIAEVRVVSAADMPEEATGRAEADAGTRVIDADEPIDRVTRSLQAALSERCGATHP